MAKQVGATNTGSAIVWINEVNWGGGVQRAGQPAKVWSAFFYRTGYFQDASSKLGPI